MDAPSRPLRRQPLRLPRVRIPFLLVFAGLSFVGLVVALGVLFYVAFDWIRVVSDPHWLQYEQSYYWKTNGVRSLIHEGVPFNVGLSVFAVKPVNVTERPECTDTERVEWNLLQDGHKKAEGRPEDPSLLDPRLSGKPPCDYLYVPKTEDLWSGIVARGLTLADKTSETDVTFDIPMETL